MMNAQHGENVKCYRMIWVLNRSNPFVARIVVECFCALLLLDLACKHAVADVVRKFSSNK